MNTLQIQGELFRKMLCKAMKLSEERIVDNNGFWGKTNLNLMK